MPKPEQPQGRNKRVHNGVPKEERMIDFDFPVVDYKTEKPMQPMERAIDLRGEEELQEKAKGTPIGSSYTGDRFELIDIGDDFAVGDDPEERKPPPTPQATPEAVRRRDGMDAFRRTPESQSPQAIVVAEFTATVNRGDPQWTGPIAKKRYCYVSPILTPDKFPLQSTEMTAEQFVDLDFSHWDASPTTQEILAEAARLGFTHLDRAASESSLSVRLTGPNGRPAVCICTDAWKNSGERVVGYVFGLADGRRLDVRGLDDDWDQGHYVFRFLAPK